MQRTLRDHIARLEQKVMSLKQELREEGIPKYQKSERELDLSNAEEALKLFQKACELERQIKS